MSRIEILKKLDEVLVMAIGSENVKEYNESTRLVEDLGLNSVGILYIVIGIEEIFEINFDDVGFSDFLIIKDVVDYIERKVNN